VWVESEPPLRRPRVDEGPSDLFILEFRRAVNYTSEESRAMKLAYIDIGAAHVMCLVSLQKIRGTTQIMKWRANRP
jgi:hypothetical protein